MIPIYEQDSGKGIGYGLDSFLKRFEHICQEHVEAGRAKAFAFIFYDFNDQGLRTVLKDQGVFAQLDRLSGKNLSIFAYRAKGGCGEVQPCSTFRAGSSRESRSTLRSLLSFSGGPTP